jgi:hypothetical protein
MFDEARHPGPYYKSKGRDFDNGCDGEQTDHRSPQRFPAQLLERGTDSFQEIFVPLEK